MLSVKTYLRPAACTCASSFFATDVQEDVVSVTKMKTKIMCILFLAIIALDCCFPNALRHCLSSPVCPLPLSSPVGFVHAKNGAKFPWALNKADKVQKGGPRRRSRPRQGDKNRGRDDKGSVSCQINLLYWVQWVSLSVTVPASAPCLCAATMYLFFGRPFKKFSKFASSPCLRLPNIVIFRVSLYSVPIIVITGVRPYENASI